MHCSNQNPSRAQSAACVSTWFCKSNASLRSVGVCHLLIVIDLKRLKGRCSCRKYCFMLKSGPPVQVTVSLRDLPSVESHEFISKANDLDYN